MVQILRPTRSTKTSNHFRVARGCASKVHFKASFLSTDRWICAKRNGSKTRFQRTQRDPENSQLMLSTLENHPPCLRACKRDRDTGNALGALRIFFSVVRERGAGGGESVRVELGIAITVISRGTRAPRFLARCRCC